MKNISRFSFSKSISASNHQGYAEMLSNGTFVIRNNAGSVYWSKATWSQGAFMWIQDNGNLLIQNKDESEILWQSNSMASC
jgi:hypothetical protein